MQIFDQPPRKPRRARPRPALPPTRLTAPAWLRRPVTWAVGAEAIVILAFALATAHLVAASALPRALPPGVPASVSQLLAPEGPGFAAPAPALGLGPGTAARLPAAAGSDSAPLMDRGRAALEAVTAALSGYLRDLFGYAAARA